MDLKPIQSLLDAEGRLTKMPSKRKKRLYALAYLADKIPADREFTEKEFTEFLNTLHTFGDAASIRREMYDCFLIDREKDGSKYKLNRNRLSAEELVEKYC